MMQRQQQEAQASTCLLATCLSTVTITQKLCITTDQPLVPTQQQKLWLLQQQQCQMLHRLLS
jgi:hypothetical protein